ncbi:MAG: four helix bundle protein [Patescibacteria group bacterium]
MNIYRDTEKDIHKRIYKFVVACFNNIVKKIPKSKENLSIIEQIGSSLTSVGANDQEADGASSSKDFVAKYMIVRKEAKETKYWLNIIKDTEILSEIIVNPYIQECHEIQMIISKIIQNVQQK